MALEDYLTQAQAIAALLKDDIHHRNVVNKITSFIYADKGQIRKSNALLLLDLDVVRFLAHVVSSRDDIQSSRNALVLLSDILSVAGDQLTELVDVNLVRTLIAKIPEQHFAFVAAEALSTIAKQSDGLREMIKGQGFMKTVLEVAENSRDEVEHYMFRRLLTNVFNFHYIYRQVGILEITSTRENSFWMILLEIHLMFGKQEYDDSPKSLQTVLRLVKHLLEKSNENEILCGIVCCLVLIDFFRHPMSAKARQLWTLNLAPKLAMFTQSTDKALASTAITCVARLACSGPLLTDQLVSSGVVHKLAKATEDGCNEVSLCLALRELVRYGKRDVMSSIECSVLKWVESRLESQDGGVRLAACTALVCMKHAEDTVPGRIGVPMGSLVGKLCSFLEKSPNSSTVDSVLTHLAVALNFAEKHLGAVSHSLVETHDCMRKLKPYTQDRKLYTSTRARVLLDHLQRLQRHASTQPSVMQVDGSDLT